MTDQAPTPGNTDPVTVVVTRKVKPGREKDYEAWLGRLQAEARSLPGYLRVPARHMPRRRRPSPRADAQGGLTL